MFDLFVRQVVNSTNPSKYAKLGLLEPGMAFGFLFKILLVSFVIMALLIFPKITSIPSSVEEKLSNIKNINVSGSFELSQPILLPEKDPLVIADTTGNITELNQAKILLTEDKIVYKNLRGTKKIYYSEITNFKDNKPKIADFISFLIILAIPNVLITLFVLLFFKYFLSALLISVIVHLLLDLTKYSISLKKCFNTAMYTLVWIVPIEVISMSFSTKYLLPFFELIKLKFFIVTTIIHLLFFGLGLAAIIFHQQKKTGVDT